MQKRLEKARELVAFRKSQVKAGVNNAAKVLKHAEAEVARLEARIARSEVAAPVVKSEAVPLPPAPVVEPEPEPEPEPKKSKKSKKGGGAKKAAKKDSEDDVEDKNTDGIGGVLMM